MPDGPTAEPLYMYAVLRGDLDMPRGKAAAQAGHAFTDALFAALLSQPDDAARYRDEGGPKAVVEARGLREIERAHEAARAAGLPCALVVDWGHVLPPHFDGSPIVTALGIGPCTKAAARPVTRKFASVGDRVRTTFAVQATVERGGKGARETRVVSAADEESLYEAMALFHPEGGEAAARDGCRSTVEFGPILRVATVHGIDEARLRAAKERLGPRDGPADEPEHGRA